VGDVDYSPGDGADLDAGFVSVAGALNISVEVPATGALPALPSSRIAPPWAPWADKTVIHGADGDEPRPTGDWASVLWIGSAEPANALDGDFWLMTE
jgi:hypothetical protein